MCGKCLKVYVKSCGFENSRQMEYAGWAYQDKMYQKVVSDIHNKQKQNKKPDSQKKESGKAKRDTSGNLKITDFMKS